MVNQEEIRIPTETKRARATIEPPIHYINKGPNTPHNMFQLYKLVSYQFPLLAVKIHKVQQAHNGIFSTHNLMHLSTLLWK